MERGALRERERALLAGELALEPGPYEAHVGFSNVCNMSCIMCWDGANPPPRKMSAELLQVVADQVAPSVSVITPVQRQRAADRLVGRDPRAVRAP